MARDRTNVNRKTILITGATDGIGKASAFELARRGHHILVHGRDAVRGERVVQEIQSASKDAEVELVLADFSSLDAVRKLAAGIQNRCPRLDVLINNAGVFMRQRVLTRDGFEMTFAVNYLAPFLLTNLLLDRMIASAPARIIHVSSGTHRGAKIDWDNLQGEKHYDAYEAYARSKLANVLFAYALADRLKGTRVTSNALHPGVIRTKLLGAGWGGSGSDLARGAETIVYAATAPELENVTGRYFDDKRETASSDRSRDKQLQLDLWRATAHRVGLERK